MLMFEIDNIHNRIKFFNRTRDMTRAVARERIFISAAALISLCKLSMIISH